jgi:hypothetical protein
MIMKGYKVFRISEGECLFSSDQLLLYLKVFVVTYILALQLHQNVQDKLHTEYVPDQGLC